MLHLTNKPNASACHRGVATFRTHANQPAVMETWRRVRLWNHRKCKHLNGRDREISGEHKAHAAHASPAPRRPLANCCQQARQCSSAVTAKPSGTNIQPKSNCELRTQSDGQTTLLSFLRMIGPSLFQQNTLTNTTSMDGRSRVSYHSQPKYCMDGRRCVSPSGVDRATNIEMQSPAAPYAAALLREHAEPQACANGRQSKKNPRSVLSFDNGVLGTIVTRQRLIGRRLLLAH